MSQSPIIREGVTPILDKVPSILLPGGRNIGTVLVGGSADHIISGIKNPFGTLKGDIKGAFAGVSANVQDPIGAIGAMVDTGNFSGAGANPFDPFTSTALAQKKAQEKSANAASEALSSSNARAADQDRIRGLGQNLASKGTQELSNLDFSGLDNSAESSALAARRDRILTSRQRPGRSQTLLAGRLSTS